MTGGHANTGGPGGGGPGGGGPGGGGPGGAPVVGQPGAGVQGPIPGGGNGSLRGHPPEMFDGTRKNADKFIREFDLWRVCNLRNEAVTNPFMRVALALSYIKGPRVDDWVFQQAKGAAVKVYGDPPNVAGIYADTDERLWAEFVHDFEAAFADSALAEQAYADLLSLNMKNEDIDEYISNFDFLLLKAGWEPTARGTLEMFKRGLPRRFHWTILQQENIPASLDEWKAAVRKEVQRRRLVAASLGQRPDWQSFQKGRQRTGRPSWRESRRDPDAMDVDVVSTRGDGDRGWQTASNRGDGDRGWQRREGGLSEEDFKKRRTEGRCYGCGRQGHLRKDCSTNKKGEGTGRGKEPGSRARTMETRDDEQAKGGKRNDDASDGPPPYNPDVFINHLKTLQGNDREELLDRLMDVDSGF